MRRFMFRFHRARWWLVRCVRYAISSSIHRANNWAPIGGGALGLAAYFLGVEMTFADGVAGATANALIGVGTAWILVFVYRLLLSPWRIWQDGTWHGNEFVYNEPVRVLTARWSPNENGRIIPFKVPQAPPFSLVTCKIEMDSGGHRIRCQVCFATHAILKLDGFQDTQFFQGEPNPSTLAKFSHRVETDRRLGLNCHSLPQTDPITVRVYVLSWEKQNVMANHHALYREKR